MCEPDSVQYLRDLIQEKEYLDNIEGHNIIKTLLNQEISRMQCGGRPPGSETPYVDIYNEKPVRVATKVLVPTKQHPKFNFVGKLLGPRGSSLKQLQHSSMTKMAILGRGSMRNPSQEEEMRLSSDPKHNHLSEDLHVEISTFASPSEAHARIALALSEVRAYLIPDSNDQIRQQQMRDIKMIKMTSSQEAENGQSVTSEDSGHDSDVSNSPTPPKPSPIDPSHVDTCRINSISGNTSSNSESNSSPHKPLMTNSNSRSIFDKLFGNITPDRKRSSFLIDSMSSGANCGEPLYKRFK